MKHILIASILLSFQVYFYAQELALEGNNVPNSDINYDYHDPIKTISGIPSRPWPDCVAPEGLTTTTANGKVRIIWDGEKILDDHYRLRIKKNSESEWIYQSIQNNYFDLPKNTFIDDIDFEVQRICHINGQEVESEWAGFFKQQALVTGCSTCAVEYSEMDNPNIDKYAVYQINPNCVYLKWKMCTVPNIKISFYGGGYIFLNPTNLEG